MTSYTEISKQERVDEFLAVINMIGYAMGIARELGVPEAASDLQSAGLKLALEVRDDISDDCTSSDIIHLATSQGGHC